MNFLIQSGSGIGSIVKQTVFAKAIKNQFADASVDVIVAGNRTTEKLNNQIVALQKYINKVYWYSAKDIKHDLSLMHILRKNKYDIGFITIENSLARKSSWIFLIMKMSGCKKLIGSGEKRLDINLDIPPQTHYFDRINSYLNQIGVDSISDYNSLEHNALPMDWVTSIGLDKTKLTIAIVMGAKMMSSEKHEEGKTYDVKSWGVEKWIELAQLLANDNCNVILIGGKNEKNQMDSDGIILPSDGCIKNMVGITSISESLALLNASNLVVGGEGGMVHCAAALGISTLTIFGGTDYKVFEPRGGKISEILYTNRSCYPCYGTRNAVQCVNHECLENIKVNDVYKTVREILDRVG